MRVGIIGLGLIGGSLGLALRALNRSLEVVGVARTPEGAAAAQRRGAVADASAEVATLRGSDIIVVATPIDQVPAVLDRIGHLIPSGTLITDVASVKRPVIEWARRLPEPGRFLGGHPVAGRTQTGLDASDPTIFRDEPWIFTPAEGQDLRPFFPWIELVEAIGARPTFLPAELHDRQMAHVSHLAFTLSAAYAETVERFADAGLGGPGYRGMVRLAAGDPWMYESISRENRQPLVEAIDRFAAILDRYRDRIEKGDRVRELFETGRHVAARA